MEVMTPPSNVLAFTLQIARIINVSSYGSSYNTVCVQEMDKETKETFFEELYKLNDSESEEDGSNAEEILRQSREITQRNRGVQRSRPDQPFGRTVSAPVPLVSTPSRDRVDNSLKAPISSLLSHTAKRDTFVDTSRQNKQTHDGTVFKNGYRANHKRKRGQSLSLMPESQQIFKNLSFFFFPNNDISPSRRFRIRKAMEWGATWIKEWEGAITHVIVDKALCYKDLLKFVKVDALPAKIVLVNESYPIDCIIFRILVNPCQPQYRVTGDVGVLSAHQSLTPVLSSDPSLQLKPGKEKLLQLQQTPSCTEGSVKDHSSQARPETRLLDNTEHGMGPLQASKPSYNALDEAIEEAKAIQDLPLGSDEDEVSDESVVPDDSEGDLSEDERRAELKSKDPFNKLPRSHFSCISKHDGTSRSENPNARTIEVLQKMADYYGRMQDHWRSTAYRKAIGALRKQNTRITTAREAFAIPFIGKRLADKIEEIVWTNRLRRLDNTTLEPNDEVLQLFMKIYGVGFTQATKWINQGHRNFNDLLTKAQLTKNQKLGIEHFDDFQARIPRQEAYGHDQYVRDACNKIDTSIQITIGGSYRRGAADSGDVDFIITKPDCSIEILRTMIVESLIPRLFQTGYLKVGLATTSKQDGTKWHGAAALPGTSIWRRIDFLLVPWEELGAALIYFTGNEIFNRSIRLLASKKGMRLNQRGLWKDVIRGKNRQRMTQGTLVEAKDEKRIFELLGVEWRPPEHRIC